MKEELAMKEVVPSITVRYCNNPNCYGHKGPKGQHCHFGDDRHIFAESPGFNSKRVGGFIIDHSLPPLRDSHSSRFIGKVEQLLRAALVAADVPEHTDMDDDFIRSWTSEESEETENPFTD